MLHFDLSFEIFEIFFNLFEIIYHISSLDIGYITS